MTSPDRPDAPKRRGPSNRTSARSGPERNVAAALSYVLGPITGVLFLLLEKQNRYVRFHAAQSLAVSVLLIILNVGVSLLAGVLAPVPLVGMPLVFVLKAGVALGTFLLWVALMWRAYQGDRWELPAAGEMARRMV
jgi:uncharacterized membrane protein